jgi:hypothetical protein
VNLAGFSGSAARSSRERAWPGRDLRVALAAGAFLADLRELGRAGPRIGSVEATTPAERRSWFGRTCMVDADEVLGRVGLDRLAHDQRSPDGVRPDRVLVPGRALDEAEPVGPAAHRGAAVAPQHPAASTTTMMWALVGHRDQPVPQHRQHVGQPGLPAPLLEVLGEDGAGVGAPVWVDAMPADPGPRGADQGPRRALGPG